MTHKKLQERTGLKLTPVFLFLVPHEAYSKTHHRWHPTGLGYTVRILFFNSTGLSIGTIKNGRVYKDMFLAEAVAKRWLAHQSTYVGSFERCAPYFLREASDRLIREELEKNL